MSKQLAFTKLVLEEAVRQARELGNPDLAQLEQSAEYFWDMAQYIWERHEEYEY